MPMEARLTLLCLPCAGASATMYLRWRRLLPEWIDLVPLELPGRGSKMSEPLLTTFDALIAYLHRHYRAHLRGRYALFGHSMGALLAYGLTGRLQQEQGILPRALIASATASPGLRDPSRLPNPDDNAAMIADLRKQGGTPDAVLQDAELLRFTLHVLAADYRVCLDFLSVPRTRLHVPLHVFGGRDDAIEPERLQAWARETSRSCTLDWFDGGHFFVRDDEPRVLATLARRLTPYAQAEAPAQHYQDEWA